MQTVIEKPRNKASSIVKSKESLKYDSPSDFSCPSCLNASCGNSSISLVTDRLNTDMPEKFFGKKYRENKSKSNKKCTGSAVLGVVDIANQTCPAPETCKTVPALSDASIDYNATLNCNSTSSIMTSSEFHFGTVDTICFSGANEANGRNVSERGSPSKDFKLDDSIHSSITSEPCLKEEAVKASTVSVSLSRYEPVVQCLSNTKECSRHNEFSSGEKLDLVEGEKCNVVHDKNWISDTSSGEIIHGVEDSNNIEKNIISDYTETLSYGCISHVSSCDNSVMCGNNGFETLVGPKESGCFGSIYRIKSINRCSRFGDGHEVISKKRAENGRKLSQSSNGRAYMHGNAKSFNQPWKENCGSILQEVQQNVRNACIQGKKRSNHNYVQLGFDTQEAALLVNHNSFSTGMLLSSPAISPFRQNCFSEEVKDVWNNEQGCQTNGHVLVKSPQWVAQQRFHGNGGQCLLQSGQDSIQKNKLCEKSKAKMNRSLKHGNFNLLKKISWANKENLYGHRTNMNLSEAESLEAASKTYFCGSTETDNFDCLTSNPVSSTHLQKNVSYSRIVGPSDKALLHEVGPSRSMNIARTYASVGSTHVSSRNKDCMSTCYEIELSYEDNVRKDFKSRVSLQKWIPICRKDSTILKGNGIVDKPILGSWKSETRQETPLPNHGSINSSMKIENFPSYDMPTELRIGSEMLEFDRLGNQGKCTGQTRKDYSPSDSVIKNISLLHIGSQKAEQVLNEAYRLQIESESVQVATGSPLAEFERLLHAASPAIFPAYVPKDSEKCSGNQIFHMSLCEHQVPNIPLIALWNWYEKPASYGLEVKAEDSKCLNVIGTRGISFHAHFVPFLSAVQLFGHSCDSKSSRLVGLTSEVAKENSKYRRAGDLISKVSKENHAAEQCAYPNFPDKQCKEVVGTKALERSSVSKLFDPAKKLIGSSDFLDSNGHASSNDIKLLFEFFESEQPQQRKPLYDK